MIDYDPLDRTEPQQSALLAEFAPHGCDRAVALRAFTVFCGAAALVAAHQAATGDLPYGTREFLRDATAFAQALLALAGALIVLGIGLATIIAKAWGWL